MTIIDLYIDSFWVVNGVATRSKSQRTSRPENTPEYDAGFSLNRYSTRLRHLRIQYRSDYSFTKHLFGYKYFKCVLCNVA